MVPQSLVVDINRKGYVNHFTNIDLTGDTVSVYDLSSQKLLTTIKTETPSFIATDNQRLYVTNYTTDSLSVFDLKTLKKDKVIPVGKWPKKVILIESTL
ncbi:MAG: YncE family protein [Carboxydocellales bacterium]